jgi:hypothetical protein
MLERLIAWNQCHLARIDLSDAKADLSNLDLRDIRWNVVCETFHNAVRKFGALRSRKLLCLFEDAGYSFGHDIRIQAPLNRASPFGIGW